MIFLFYSGFQLTGWGLPTCQPSKLICEINHHPHTFTNGQELGGTTLILNCIGSKIFYKKNELKIKTYELYKVVIISPFHHFSAITNTFQYLRIWKNRQERGKDSGNVHSPLFNWPFCLIFSSLEQSEKKCGVLIFHS